MPMDNEKELLSNMEEGSDSLHETAETTEETIEKAADESTDTLNNTADFFGTDNGTDISDVTDKFSDIENELMLLQEGKKKQKKHRSINRALMTVFTGSMLAVITVFSVYCIASDIKASGNIREEKRPDFSLDTQSRPFSDTELRDESGKYTVEGVAQLVRPRVVEIVAYKNDTADSAVAGGSGIIISGDGYIVTNTHIIDGMDKYAVKTYDGKVYSAELAGRDAKTDISVLKIDARGLTAAEFGNSDEVIQGEQVVAVGNPAGLAGSITNGIVSGLDRKVRGDSTAFLMNCIQTDAAISPGNSGGALVNMYGQVIGIVSSKYASTSSEGLGFAITINDAKPIIEELITQGYVSGRVKIGITFDSMNTAYGALKFKDKFGFEVPSDLKNSIWIEKISDDCDIANTELKANDFMLSLDGHPLPDYDSLSKAISGKKGGDKVKAECARVEKNGDLKRFTIEFKLMTDTSGDF